MNYLQDNYRLRIDAANLSAKIDELKRAMEERNELDPVALQNADHLLYWMESSLQCLRNCFQHNESKIDGFESLAINVQVGNELFPAFIKTPTGKAQELVAKFRTENDEPLAEVEKAPAEPKESTESFDLSQNYLVNERNVLGQKIKDMEGFLDTAEVAAGYDYVRLANMRSQLAAMKLYDDYLDARLNRPDHLYCYLAFFDKPEGFEVVPKQLSKLLNQVIADIRPDLEATVMPEASTEEGKHYYGVDLRSKYAGPLSFKFTDAAHAQPASQEDSNAVDEALGLVETTLRMKEDLYEDASRRAVEKGMHTQVYIRSLIEKDVLKAARKKIAT